ncbi:MAG: hypothetical protein NWQ09_10775 [Nonlabens sp.]|nr:hypothetical protein [Nonlabens sp.]
MILPLRQTIFSTEIIKSIIKPYGKLHFLEDIFVLEVNYLVNFVWDHQADVIEDLEQFYGDSLHRVVYISNRVYHFDCNPLIWVKLKNLNLRIKGIAIVSDLHCNKLQKVVESLFLPVNVLYYDCMINAFQWAATMNQSAFLEVI